MKISVVERERYEMKSCVLAFEVKSSLSITSAWLEPFLGPDLPVLRVFSTTLAVWVTESWEYERLEATGDGLELEAEV